MANFRDTVSLTRRKFRKSKICPEQLSRTQVSCTTYRIFLYFFFFFCKRAIFIAQLLYFAWLGDANASQGDSKKCAEIPLIKPVRALVYGSLD